MNSYTRATAPTLTVHGALLQLTLTRAYAV